MVVGSESDFLLLINYYLNLLSATYNSLQSAIHTSSVPQIIDEFGAKQKKMQRVLRWFGFRVGSPQLLI